jgi:transposase
MKAYSIDLRQKIIDAYQREKISQSDLALRFGVSQSFVSKLVKQYRETGEVAPKPFRGGVKLTLQPKDLEILAELIENNNDASLEELCELLKEKTGIVISRATMGRMTKKLNFTWKKKTIHPTEKESERVQKLRGDFWDKIRSVPVKNLVFVDEFGVNLALVRLNARAKKRKKELEETVLKSEGKMFLV